jgi:hypothetical protein
MYTAELHRRQIICQLHAEKRGLTITQQKRYCSRCPYLNNIRVRGFIPTGAPFSETNASILVMVP